MKKVLHMVGHSHIDPVWFWRWEEGMQEVKATFRSALERMEAFADFRFTSTSAAFFAYVQRVDPELFEQIRRRVQEGRWEIVGGWWVEPDCNLPCGEAFVRRTFKRNWAFAAPSEPTWTPLAIIHNCPKFSKKAAWKATCFCVRR